MHDAPGVLCSQLNSGLNFLVAKKARGSDVRCRIG